MHIRNAIKIDETTEIQNMIHVYVSIINVEHQISPKVACFPYFDCPQPKS